MRLRRIERPIKRVGRYVEGTGVAGEPGLPEYFYSLRSKSVVVHQWRRHGQQFRGRIVELQSPTRKAKAVVTTSAAESVEGPMCVGVYLFASIDAGSSTKAIVRIDLGSMRCVRLTVPPRLGVQRLRVCGVKSPRRVVVYSDDDLGTGDEKFEIDFATRRFRRQP